METHLTLLDLFRLVFKHIKLFFLIYFLCLAVAFYIALTSPKIYRAKALIMPIDSPSSTNLAANLSAFTGMMSPANNSNKIIVFLNSFTMARRAFKPIEYDLLAYFYPKLWDPETKSWKKGARPPHNEDVIGALQGSMSFIIDPTRNNSIEINADFKDPILAQKAAATYVRELRVYLNELDDKIFERDRNFFLTQLEKNEKDILDKVKMLNQFPATYPVRNASGLVNVDLSQQTPSEKKGKSKNSRDDNIINDVPIDAFLTYLSSKQSTLVDINKQLEMQYQLSKIETEKSKLLFNVVDEPLVPRAPFKPNRLLIAIVGAVFGVVASTATVIAVNTVKKLFASERFTTLQPAPFKEPTRTAPA